MAKVAIVCAASRGLGRAAALALARDGARLTVCARDASRLDLAATAIREETGADVLAVPADLGRAADVERVVEATVGRFGGVDVLVTNTGGPPSGPFEAFADEDWRAAFDGLLLSVVRLIRSVLPHMRRARSGRIVLLTSAAVKQPIEGLVLSNSLRAAVTGLAKTLASELAPDGIRVNCVAPGYVRTDRVLALAEQAAARDGVTAASVIERLVSGIPAGRLGEPSDIGDVVAFLASERAAYLTGATIQVDGGLVRGLL